MAYPKELYAALTDFAQAHRTDKLNALTLLFAAQRWVDIMGHLTGMLEPFAANKGLPNTSLPIFLINFEHWVRVNEHLQCLQFIHPFRWMKEIAMEKRSISSR
jgi:hypothetical protein